MEITIRKFLFIFALSALISLGGATTSWALTTINVDTTDDELNADGDTSLREAFDQVDTGVDTEYVINLEGGATYPLSLGPLMTEREGINLTINGNGNGLGLAKIDATANPAGNTGAFSFVNQSVLHPIPIDVTLNDLEITGSGAADHQTLLSAVGLGVRIFHGDRLTINRCYIHDNFGEFGAINPVSVEYVTINDSTLASNTSDQLGGAYNGQNTNLEINNTTITGNVSVQLGGGIRPAANTIMRNTTITDNHADKGGGLFLFSGTQLDIQNSIVAGNTATTSGDNCDTTFGGGPANFISGYNVLGDLIPDCTPTSSAGPDQTNVSDPMLGALADNGGPTPTHEVLAGSPALENGDPSGCKDTSGADLIYDQRGFGFPRVEDGDGDGTAVCDSGAYERTNPFTQIGDSITELTDGVSDLPAGAFGNGNKQAATLNKISAVEGQFAAIQAETDPVVRAALIQDLENKLIHDLLAKGDGCPTEPDNNDWIIDCDAQATYQALIQDMLDLLDTL